MLAGLLAAPGAALAAGEEIPISSEAFVAMLRWMENEQQQMEWWFQLLASFLGVAIVLLLIGSVAVPLLMLRVQRRRMAKYIGEADRATPSSEPAAEPQSAPTRPKHSPRYQSALKEAPPVFGLLEDKRRESEAAVSEAVSEAMADPEASTETRLRAYALQSEVQRQWIEASALWHALNHLDQRDGQALFGEAHARQQLARRFSSPYLQNELKAISTLCQRVIQLDPDFQPAHGLRGITLAELARCSTDSGTAAALFLRADSCFREAISRSPLDVSLHCARAAALRDHARAGASEANRDYARATDAWLAALDLQPDCAEALDGLIDTQTERAWMNYVAHKPVEELFDLLDKRLEASLTITGRSPEALRRQVHSLAARLRFVAPQKARGHFQIARDKAREIHSSLPDDRRTLQAWGLAQLHLGCHANPGGTMRKRLFGQAEKAFQRCEQLLPGSAAFELARLAALRGAPGRCRRWIERARETDSLPPCSVLLAAPDLSLVRHSPWYNQLLAERNCAGLPAASKATSDTGRQPSLRDRQRSEQSGEARLKANPGRHTEPRARPNRGPDTAAADSTQRSAERLTRLINESTN